MGREYSPDPQFYSCFDFSIRSTLALPEMHAADPAGAPVVQIRIDALPERLPGGQDSGQGLQIAGDIVQLNVPETARYRVRGGCEILVHPLPGAAPRNVRLFLLGSALGILCHQRGLLLLHANAVVADGAAFAFAGESGAGKSTLAAHFQRAGYPILCDDVCAVRLDAAGAPRAWPGLPRLKLWGDAATAFGYDRASLEPAIEGLDKYHVPLAAPPAAGPVPLRRLYLLSRAAPGEAGSPVRLRGAAAMEAILSQTYRAHYLIPMGLAAPHFRHCAALLQQIEVFAAPRAWGFGVFAREAERLERHMTQDQLQSEDAA